MPDQSDGTKYDAKHPRPGVGGAIQDAIAAISNAFAPRSVQQRKAKLDQAEQAAGSQSSSPDLGDQF